MMENNKRNGIFKVIIGTIFSGTVITLIVGMIQLGVYRERVDGLKSGFDLHMEDVQLRLAQFEIVKTQQAVMINQLQQINGTLEEIKKDLMRRR